MIDNMQGLFPSASDAYAAGKKSGLAEACRHALNQLSAISVKHEKAQDSAAFRASEECCAAVREVKRALVNE